MLNNILTRQTTSSYVDIVRPTMFFTNMYTRNTPTNSLKISQDIIRKLERVAEDVAAGTGPANVRKLSPFTNKEYIPPEYNEAFTISAGEANERMAGATSYDSVDRMARLTNFIAESQSESTEIIERAIELQAVNAMLDGALTLKNGDVIEYNQKTTHQIVGVDWTVAANNIIGDIKAAADLVRKDGKGTADTIILGSDMLEGLLINTVLKERLDNRRIDIGDITSPLKAGPESGAAFHGRISIDAYKFDLWSYPQFYEDAADVSTAYLGAKKAIVIDSNARMDLHFGALHRFADGNMEGALAAGMGSPLAQSAATEFATYMFMSEDGLALLSGVRSRPLCVPTAIDKHVVITSA